MIDVIGDRRRSSLVGVVFRLWFGSKLKILAEEVGDNFGGKLLSDDPVRCQCKRESEKFRPQSRQRA